VPFHGHRGLDAFGFLGIGRDQFHSCPVVREFLTAIETHDVSSRDARGGRATLVSLGRDGETVVLVPAAEHHVDQIEDHVTHPLAGYPSLTTMQRLVKLRTRRACSVRHSSRTHDVSSRDARGGRATLVSLGRDGETVVLVPAAKHHVDQIENHEVTPWPVIRA
jgi:hypothetical protein